MDLKTKIVALIGALALLTAPAAALAQGQPEYKPAHPSHPETPNQHSQQLPGPKAPMPAKAKAYGVLCRTESKQHTEGKKGTPFSECVKAMAIAASTKKTARAACKELSKTHKAGEKGTPFSQCVVAAAKLKKEVTAG